MALHPRVPCARPKGSGLRPRFRDDKNARDEEAERGQGSSLASLQLS
jgi:hypothetical protein